MNRTSFQLTRRLARSPATLWELIDSCDGPILASYQACQDLVAAGTVEFAGGRFALTEQGRAEYGLFFREGFGEELARYEEIVREVPPSSTDFFQQRIRTPDLFRRIEFMYERGDLADRRVFILGDDDYLSIALALIGLARRITVVEIDTRITSFIERTASRLGLEVEVSVYNAADPLPAELTGRFDTFVTDPVETSKGFTTTMSRGFAALRHPGAVYFGLTEIECPPQRWYEFQGMFHRAGLVVTDIIRDHTRYLDDPDNDPSSFALLRRSPFPVGSLPDYGWYRSSFYRLITVRTPEPPIKGKIPFDSSFYQDEFVMTL